MIHNDFYFMFNNFVIIILTNPCQKYNNRRNNNIHQREIKQILKVFKFFFL